MSLALESQSFDSEVLAAEQPVLVDFWATWCAPCLALAPTVEQLAERYDGRVKVAKVDVDQAPDLARRYGVLSIPTVIIFQGGQEVARLVGTRPLSAYANELDRLLS